MRQYASEERSTLPAAGDLAEGVVMRQRPPSRSTSLALIATLALALVIGYLTLAPISDAGVPGSDKLHHALGFFALAVPLSYARPRLAIWIVFAATAYGGAIELIQPTVGRDQDVWDFLADGVGAVAGAAVGVGLHCLRRRGAA